MPTTKLLNAVLFAAVATGLASLPAHAAAPYVSAPGTLCRPYLGSTTAWVSDFGGFQSTTNTAMEVSCPLPLGPVTSTNTVTFHSVIMYYEDASNTGAFSCRMYQRNANGTVFLTPTKYTSSLPGGAPDPTTSYVGPGYLSWTNTDLGTDLIRVDATNVVKCTVAQNGGIIRHYYSQF